MLSPSSEDDQHSTTTLNSSTDSLHHNSQELLIPKNDSNSSSIHEILQEELQHFEEDSDTNFMRHNFTVQNNLTDMELQYVQSHPKQVRRLRKAEKKHQKKARGIGLASILFGHLHYYEHKPKHADSFLAPHGDALFLWDDHPHTQKDSEDSSESTSTPATPVEKLDLNQISLIQPTSTPTSSVRETEELKKPQKPPAKTPPLIIRIFVLLCFCVWIFGPACGYSSLGALSGKFRSFLEIDDTQYMLLFSLYALPNIICVFLAGLVMDRIGPGITSIVFTFCALLGFALSLIPNYYVSILARILYGLGSECIATVKSAMIARWFKTDKVVSIAIASAVALVSYRAAAFFVLFAIPQIAAVTPTPQWSMISLLAITCVSAMACLCLVGLGIFYSDYLDQNRGKRMKLHITDLCKLGSTFWVLMIVNFCLYSSMLPLVSVSTGFITKKFGFTVETANACVSILYAVAIVVMLLTAVIIDRIGHRIFMILLCFVFILMGYNLLLFTDVTPWISCVVLGIAYGMGPSALWPSIPILVDPSKLGLAYGVLNGILNLGLFIVPFYLGYVSNSFYKLLALMIHASVGFVAVIVVLIWDRFLNKGKLEWTVIAKARVSPLKKLYKLIYKHQHRKEKDSTTGSTIVLKKLVPNKLHVSLHTMKQEETTVVENQVSKNSQPK